MSASHHWPLKMVNDDGFQCLFDFRDNVTEEEYRAANRAAKMKGRCDDEPRKPRVRKVKDKTPL